MIGIQNVSGVSCHISCALQLIAHGVTPLTTLFHDLIPSFNDNDMVLKELGRILVELTESSTSLPSSDEEKTTVIDPTPLYRMLEKQTNLNPYDVGDVSTAIYQIFRLIGTISPIWKEMVDHLVGSGQTQQLIYGRLQNNNKLLRIKRGKIKSMAYPYPLPLLLDSSRNHHDVLPSLNAIWKNSIHPSPALGSPIKDYDWTSQAVDTYTEEILSESFEDSNSIVGWKTTRCVHVLQVPQFFFCSLDRFGFTPDGERILKVPKIDIPMMMKIDEMKDDMVEYQLLGGVVHVSEESIDEEGHYVSVIRRDTTNDSDSCWVLIDDERTESINDSTGLNYLQGTTSDDGTYYCAVLLLFGRQEKQDDGWVDLTSTIRQYYTSRYIDWSNPKSLVGRKLRVAWAKGKLYAGIVDSYDDTTGKHRVLYEDGDIREYNLQKKTIEWDI